MPVTCVHCGSEDLWRIPRYWFERIIATKAFICHRCNKRTLEYRISKGKDAKAA